MNEVNTDELKNLKNKRTALDKLVAFTQQIGQLAKTLDAALEIAKPSQQPNKKLFPILQQLMSHIKPLQSEKLVVSLDLIDRDIQKELDVILKLSEMNEIEFEQYLEQRPLEKIGLTHQNDPHFKTAYEELAQEVHNFKRKTQTDVAIRYELSHRGLPIRASDLPIGQEKLSEKAVSLKQQERHCKQKIESCIHALLQDTQSILDNAQYPPDLKNKITLVQHELTQNLTALNDEEAFEQLPVFVASENLPPHTQDDPPSQEHKRTTPATHSNEIPIRTVFSLFFEWIKSPWHVTWKSLKEKHQRKH